MDTLKEHLGKVLVLVKQQVVGLHFLISLKNEPVFLRAFRPKASKVSSRMYVSAGHLEMATFYDKQLQNNN